MDDVHCPLCGAGKLRADTICRTCYTAFDAVRVAYKEEYLCVPQSALLATNGDGIRLRELVRQQRGLTISRALSAPSGIKEPKVIDLEEDARQIQAWFDTVLDNQVPLQYTKRWHDAI